MIPIYDDNPALGKPLLVISIIIACIIIWFWQSGLGYQDNNTVITNFGLTPAAFLGKMQQPGTFLSIFYLIYFYVYAWGFYAFSG